MNSPCPTHIDCEGIDSPVVNFSSELPDILYFSSATYNDFNPYQPPPLDPPAPDDPDGPYYKSKDCFGVVYSAASQAEADRMAKEASVNCTKSDNENVCYNEQVTATVQCEDGSTSTYVVAAGSFASAYGGTSTPEPTTPPTPTPVPPPTPPPVPPTIVPTVVIVSQVADSTATFSCSHLEIGSVYLISVLSSVLGQVDLTGAAFTATDSSMVITILTGGLGSLSNPSIAVSP